MLLSFFDIALRKAQVGAREAVSAGFANSALEPGFLSEPWLGGCCGGFGLGGGARLLVFLEMQDVAEKGVVFCSRLS